MQLSAFLSITAVHVVELTWSHFHYVSVSDSSLTIWGNTLCLYLNSTVRDRTVP